MIVLDTHVWVWLAADPEQVTRRGRSAIQRALRSDGIAVSSISLWEAAMLIERGRVLAGGSPESAVRELIDATGVLVREITPAVAGLAVGLPDSFPRDPADRIIAATARAQGSVLVTRDERIRDSGLVETVW